MDIRVNIFPPILCSDTFFVLLSLFFFFFAFHIIQTTSFQIEIKNSFCLVKKCSKWVQPIRLNSFRTFFLMSSRFSFFCSLKADLAKPFRTAINQLKKQIRTNTNKKSLNTPIQTQTLILIHKQVIKNKS